MSDDPVAILITRTARQDRAAFRELYAQAAPKLTGVLVRMLRDHSEMEDALQEVFIRVWQRAAQFDAERGHGMGWLIAVARNHALDRLRARPAQPSRPNGRAGDDDLSDDPVARLPDPGPGVEGQLVAQGDMRRVVDCFGQLEPERARAVRGAYLMGLSYQELAARHDVPLNTIRTWLRRSLLRLKECLEQ
ncbi:MAG: sigma-70 family RNA polymerase sigma factor [Pararhodobacter sp.]